MFIHIFLIYHGKRYLLEEALHLNERDCQSTKRSIYFARCSQFLVSFINSTKCII